MKHKFSLWQRLVEFIFNLHIGSKFSRTELIECMEPLNDCQVDVYVWYLSRVGILREEIKDIYKVIKRPDYGLKITTCKDLLTRTKN